MSTRVTKKIVTPFEALDVSGAVLMVNLYDPQAPTARLFLDAIRSAGIPFLALGNKLDLVSGQAVAQSQADLGVDLHPMSLLTGENVSTAIARIERQFPSGARIAVLGVFNAGKTSLIARLTGKELKVGDMPGTTLEFEEHPWNGRLLIDSVGQVIDVNRPFMVGYDFTGCQTGEEMFDRALRLEAEGILSTLVTARDGFVQALDRIHERIAAGGKIVTTGAGGSALVAEEIAGQCYETGVPCLCITNSMAQALPVSFAKGTAEEEGGLARYIADSVGPGDVLIGVSASGGTGFVYEALRLARGKGALTVAITENRDTPLGKNADVIIKSNAKPEGPSSTRVQTAHLALAHALVCSLASLRGLTAEDSIRYMLPERIATKKMGIK
jgi:D-arabinose 5-phosphate isomerase GutQ/GTP-binding protein EngB required for normal cell division